MNSKFLQYSSNFRLQVKFRLPFFTFSIVKQGFDQTSACALYSILKHFVISFSIEFLCSEQNFKPQTIDYFERKVHTVLAHCNSCWETWEGSTPLASTLLLKEVHWAAPGWQLAALAAIVNSCSNEHQFQFTRTFCPSPTNAMQGIVIKKFVYFSFVQRANIESKVK